MPLITQDAQTEAELQIVYHALMIIQRTLDSQAKEATNKARLIGMKQALEAACKLATDNSDEEWTQLRARALGAARHHYNNNGVDAEPQWRRKQRTA